MNLSQIRTVSKRKKAKRVGRGVGTGRGKTSGRGHKGAGQRKGRMHYIGFQGGNVPYLRKIPKKGFTPKRRLEFQIVNLGEIAKKMKGKKEIDPQSLKEALLIKDAKRPVKILAKLKGDFSASCVFKAHEFSRNAKEIIEKAGGKVECLVP